MSLVIFDRRHLVLRARSLTTAVGSSLLHTVPNSSDIQTVFFPSSDECMRLSIAATLVPKAVGKRF
jgi:hypothetical protein